MRSDYPISDAFARLVCSMIEAAGGSITITPAIVEETYLNCCAEYNWKLKQEKLPDGSIVYSIEKGIVHPDQIPLNLPNTNTGD